MRFPHLHVLAFLTAVIAAPGAHRLAAQQSAELTAPPEADVDDATYARAVALLDTALVRPERADQVALLRPETHLLRRLLAAVAQDPRAPVYARGNALLMLGDGGARRLDVFALALRDTAVDVRAAGAVGLGTQLSRSYDERTVALLERALRDTSLDVRARALEGLADNAPPALRRYLATDPQEPLASIARSMLTLAQQRGAPSAEGDAVLGDIDKPDPSGAWLEFRPERTWPELEAARGRLTLRPPDGAEIDLGDGVEVVGGVVPAFLTPDGSAVVWEAHREIRVLDIATGESRTLGPGIAPRPYPLRSTVIYFAPRDDVPPVRGRGGLEVLYDVIEVRPDGSGARALGSVTVHPDANVRGGYSPLRWVRVRDAGGKFTLEDDSGVVFTLPDPFELPE